MNSMNETIHKVYLEAMNIANLEPWETINDSEVFAIEHPVSHLLYFVQVVGKSQPLFGIQISKGYEAYLRLQDWLKYGDSSIKANRLALYSLYYDFEPLQEIDAQRLSIAEVSAPTLKGWPRFRDFTPEYLPWHPSDEDFSILELLLPQIRLMLQIAKTAPTSLSSPDGCLIRRLQQGIWHTEVQNRMPEEREKLSYLRPEQPQAIRELPSNSGATFEAILGLSDIPFQTKVGERPFYPWIFLLIDAADGQLLDYRLTARSESFASVSEGFIEALAKAGYRPGEILVDTEMTQVILTGVCQDLNIPVRKATLEFGAKLLSLIQKKIATSA